MYNEIIGVNIVFASFAGLLNFDFVPTAYRRTFRFGKQFFNLFSTHPLKMSNPFRLVLMSQPHICHWSLIVILICIFVFVIFNNYFVHANRILCIKCKLRHIQIWYLFVLWILRILECEKAIETSFKCWMPIALWTYANWVFILHTMRPNVSLKFYFKLLFSMLLCATLYRMRNALERINDKLCFWFTGLENSASTFSPRVQNSFYILQLKSYSNCFRLNFISFPYKLSRAYAIRQCDTG